MFVSIIIGSFYKLKIYIVTPVKFFKKDIGKLKSV